MKKLYRYMYFPAHADVITAGFFFYKVHKDISNIITLIEILQSVAMRSLL